MPRAIIGTGRTGYGSAPKIQLDDDCGRAKGCGCGCGPDGGGGDDGGLIDVLPVLEVILRQRVGYNDDGIPIFDWVVLSEGPAIAYEKREEWDNDAGATVIQARMVIPNLKKLDMLPETAVIREKGTMITWQIKASATFPDRFEVEGYRLWREVPGPDQVEVDL